MKRLLAGLSALAVMGITGRAVAEAELTGRAERVIYDSPLAFGLDLQYASITYPNYLWSGEHAMEKQGHGLRFALEWLPFGEINVGKLGIGIGAGLNQVKGVSYGTEQKASLTTVPLEAFLSYRFDYLRQQFFVPFVKAGPGLTFARPQTEYGPGRDAWYTYTGLSWAAGAELCLSPLEKRSARLLDQNFGINDTYIVFEYQKTVALGARREIDLAHQEFRLGLRFEM